MEGSLVTAVEGYRAWHPFLRLARSPHVDQWWAQVMEEKAALDTLVLAVLEDLQLHTHILQVLMAAQAKVFYHRPQVLKVVLVMVFYHKPQALKAVPAMVVYRIQVLRVGLVKAVCRSLGLKDFYRSPQVPDHRTDRADLAGGCHYHIQVEVDLGLVSILPPSCLHQRQLPSLPLVWPPFHSHLFQVRSQDPLCHILWAAQNLPCPFPKTLENSLSRQNIGALSLVVLIGLFLSHLVALDRKH